MTLLSKPIAVVLSSEDAALFALFQQHYDKIAYLISQGAFDIKHGSAILNFDRDGNISSLERRLFSYPKKNMV